MLLSTALLQVGLAALQPPAVVLMTQTKAVALKVIAVEEEEVGISAIVRTITTTMRLLQAVTVITQVIS